MTYRVRLTTKAKRPLEEHYLWYAERSPGNAAKWYNGFVKALKSLRHNPHRHPIARESSSFPIELRNLLYGTGRRKTHRALFTIRPDGVVVYAIRHTAQADLTAEDI
jgi:plasmid stabilization system protein ParE